MDLAYRSHAFIVFRLCATERVSLLNLITTDSDLYQRDYLLRITCTYV